MNHQTVNTPKAPQPIGPYTQAVKVGAFIFVSGQIPLNPQTMELVSGDISIQTRQVLNNLTAILEAAEANLQHVVKTTVFLKNMNDFQSMNQVYGEFFTEVFPARSTVEVSRLPKDVLVEIEVVAYKA